jgi:hypothetical protein
MADLNMNNSGRSVNGESDPNPSPAPGADSARARKKTPKRKPAPGSSKAAQARKKGRRKASTPGANGAAGTKSGKRKPAARSSDSTKARKRRRREAPADGASGEAGSVTETGASKAPVDVASGAAGSAPAADANGTTSDDDFPTVWTQGEMRNRWYRAKMVGYDRDGRPLVHWGNGRPVPRDPSSVVDRDGVSLDEKFGIVDGRLIRLGEKYVLHPDADGRRRIANVMSPNERGDGNETGEQDGGHPYFVRDGRTFLSLPDDKGDVPIADWTARIVQRIERHEAGIVKARFRIVATHSDPRVVDRTAIVAADKYASIQKWVHSDLGPEFWMAAGTTLKDHVASAIQIFSRIAAGGAIPVVKEYVSFGWIDLDGRNLYLHAGGVIGGDGLGVEIIVDPPMELSSYRLPEPPDSETMRKAIEKYLEIERLAVEERPRSCEAAVVTMTLPLRAVLGFLNASVHLGGDTQAYKTALARLMMQFFALSGGYDDKLSADW